MTGSMETRLKRLRFRACHRGMQETDRLLGGFAESALDTLDAAQLRCFEGLLEESDGDLLDWISGRRTPPERLDNDVMRMLIDFGKSI